jgi:hypothetical protein
MHLEVIGMLEASCSGIRPLACNIIHLPAVEKSASVMMPAKLLQSIRSISMAYADLNINEVIDADLVMNGTVDVRGHEESE